MRGTEEDQALRARRLFPSGDEQFEQLAARGAAMTRDDFNTMLLREIDAILDNMDDQAGTP